MPDHPTIFFIRHGETDWNRDRRYQGQRDVPMNETGRAQALRNGTALRSLLPNIAQSDFISSPLGRAQETMQIVRTALDLDPRGYRVDPLLVELSYGDWEGTLQDELAVLDPTGFAARQQDPFRWRPKGGESYADLLERVRTWASTLTRECVVVSHGGVSRSLRALLLGLDVATVPDLESPQDRILQLSGGTMRWL